MSPEVDWTFFFKKRLLRVVPAYILSVVIALFLALPLMKFAGASPYEFLAEFPRLFSFGLVGLPTINGFNFVRLVGVNWTLAYEWRYYVMLPLVFKVGGVLVAVFVVVVYLLTWYKFPNYGVLRWLMMTLLFCALAIWRPSFLTLRPVVAMGVASYSFYLLHVMVMFGFFYWSRRGVFRRIERPFIRLLKA